MSDNTISAGGSQFLLTIDHVPGEQESQLNLSARKQAIIPRAANLRQTPFVGDRLARPGILYERMFAVYSPESRLLCDEVVPLRGGMGKWPSDSVRQLADSRVVSVAANRRAPRDDQEPLDRFRCLVAHYTREQACCRLSPAPVRNLRQHWDAGNGAITEGRAPR